MEIWRQKMKKVSYYSLVSILAGVLTLFAVSSSIAETATVIGTISEEFYLETDLGERYEIGETQKGDELLEYVGQKVQVNGTIVEEEGNRTINVISFKLIENEG
jgi:hypothetical protein